MLLFLKALKSVWLQILTATPARIIMYKVDKSGNILGT